MVPISNPGDRAQSPAYAGSSMRQGAHARRAAGGDVDFLARDVPTTSAWSGSGGRWRLWPLRAVLWAALIVIIFRGVTAIVLDSTSTPVGSAAQPTTAASQFPATLAEAYALQFGQAYLNFSPATQVQREQQLASFLPAGLATANPDLGWNGSGQAHLQSEQVAGISVQDAQHAVVNVLATVNGQLMELGIPIFAVGDHVVVSGQPAWLSAPQPISPPAPTSVSSDPVALGELMNELPAFFQAYAKGDAAALNRFLVPGASLSGLGGSVAFDSIANLMVPRGGSARHISATVVWQVLNQGNPTSTKISMTYGVSVVDLQSGKWYVNGISASTEAVGGQ